MSEVYQAYVSYSDGSYTRRTFDDLMLALLFLSNRAEEGGAVICCLYFPTKSEPINAEADTTPARSLPLPADGE